MTEPRSRRVFFGTWPDKAATCRLSALAQELAAAGGGRPTRSAALHLTLAFVGAVSPERIRLLETIGHEVRADAFDLSLDRLGFWPRSGILWAGCRQSPAPLLRLGEALAAALGAAGFCLDRPGTDLMAHVTLARGVRRAALQRLASPVRWRVGGFDLVESHLHPSPASYKSLASFPLAEANGVCE
jgi:2'-5' RNA ligase